MRDKTLFLKNFNWRMLLMRISVNMLALLVTVLVVPKVYFVDRSLGSWLLMAVILGVLNALIKPIIQFLTLRFIFVTVGMVLIIINTIILYLLALLLPSLFAVANLFWAIIAGAVLGLSSSFLESLLGLTPPIVSDKYPEIRQRVKDRRFYRVQAELSKIEAQKIGSARELAAAKAIVLDTNPAVTELIKSNDPNGVKPIIQQETAVGTMPDDRGITANPALEVMVSVKSMTTNTNVPETDDMQAEPEITSMIDEITKFSYPTDYIEGIGPMFKYRLSNCGVETINDLLARGTTQKDRDVLAKQSGISSNLLMKWINSADLLRIKGIGSEYANLLAAAGVDSVIELAQQSPNLLLVELLALNEEKKLVRRPPAGSQVEDWVVQAKQLPQLISY